jgi:Double zinc ribbon
MSASGGRPPKKAKCPRCGALLLSDAKFCGQCFLSFRPAGRSRREIPPPPPRPDLAAQPEVGATAPPEGRSAVVTPERRAPGWPCPVCGFLNPLDRNVCQVCTTPFAALFEEQRPEAKRDPQRIGRASLMLPGLGHIQAGRVGEGVARALLFLWWFVGAISLFVFRSPNGPLVPLAGIFLIAAATVYAFSAVDAKRLAHGEAQILPARLLLYGSAVLVMLAVGWIIVSAMHVSHEVHSLTPSP